MIWEDLSSTIALSPALNPSLAAATSRGRRGLGFVIFLVLTRQTLPTFFDQRQIEESTQVAVDSGNRKGVSFAS